MGDDDLCQEGPCPKSSDAACRTPPQWVPGAHAPAAGSRRAAWRVDIASDGQVQHGLTAPSSDPARWDGLLRITPLVDMAGFRVDGEVDLNGHAELAAALARWTHSSGDIVVDLAGAEFVDVGGLRLVCADRARAATWAGAGAAPGPADPAAATRDNELGRNSRAASRTVTVQAAACCSHDNENRLGDKLSDDRHVRARTSTDVSE